MYSIVQSIVDKAVGEETNEDEYKAIETIDLIDGIRHEDRPNSLLTQISKDLYLFGRILTGVEYFLFTENQKPFHEQRNLRTKSIDELLLMDEGKACVAEAINLRQGRAQAFMGVCRELGVAWPELFTTTFQVPNIVVFGLDYKFDDTHASFAQTLVRYVRNWAAFAETMIKATDYKSELLVGFEAMCKSYGLCVIVGRKRKRDGPATRVNVISEIAVHTHRDQWLKTLAKKRL
jgi:hypothetical protein